MSSHTIAFSCLFSAAISVVYFSKNFCCGWSLGFLSSVCSGKLLLCPGGGRVPSFSSLRKQNLNVAQTTFISCHLISKRFLGKKITRFDDLVLIIAAANVN